jgi:hypothetical protein
MILFGRQLLGLIPKLLFHITLAIKNKTNTNPSSTISSTTSIHYTSMKLTSSVITLLCAAMGMGFSSQSQVAAASVVVSSHSNGA